MSPRILAVVCLATLLTAAAPQPPVVNQLFGEWKVVDSACTGCKVGHGSEVGARIIIGPGAIRNPFGSDCTGTVGIQEVRRESVTATFRRYRLPAVWLPKSNHSMPIAELQVTCNDGDNAHFILLKQNEVLMPYEADTVMRLSRQP